MILNSDNEERYDLLHPMDRRSPDLSASGSFWPAQFAGPPAAVADPEPGVTASTEIGYTADLYCRASPRGRGAVRCAMRILPWQGCRGWGVGSGPHPVGNGCSGRPRR